MAFLLAPCRSNFWSARIAACFQHTRRSLFIRTEDKDPRLEERIRSVICSTLLLLSGDIELNPGPVTTRLMAQRARVTHSRERETLRSVTVGESSHGGAEAGLDGPSADRHGDGTRRSAGRGEERRRRDAQVQATRRLSFRSARRTACTQSGSFRWTNP